MNSPKYVENSQVSAMDSMALFHCTLDDCRLAMMQADVMRTMLDMHHVDVAMFSSLNHVDCLLYSDLCVTLRRYGTHLKNRLHSLYHLLGHFRFYLRQATHSHIRRFCDNFC